MNLLVDNSPWADWGTDMVRESDSETVVFLMDRPTSADLDIVGTSIRGVVRAPWIVAAGDVFLSGGERLEVVSIQPSTDHQVASVLFMTLGYRTTITAPGSASVRIRATMISVVEPTFPGESEGDFPVYLDEMAL